MAELQVHAIVLRRRDSGESDRRLTILSREAGKIDIIAKGARKAGSRLAGSSDPLTVAQLSLATGKRNMFITGTQPLKSFRGLRQDFERLQLALALAELFAGTLPYDEPAEDAYDLLLRSLEAVEGGERPLVSSLWAQLQLLSLSGFLPSFESSAVSGVLVAEAEPFLSPHAGGYVTYEEAVRYTDRFQTKAEVLYGLSKLAQLDAPPPNLKLARESYFALLPFWRGIIDAPLPANEAVVAEMRLDQK